jgi:hypothetical protein
MLNSVVLAPMQGHRQHGDERESRTAPEQPDGVTDVVTHARPRLVSGGRRHDGRGSRDAAAEGGGIGSPDGDEIVDAAVGVGRVAAVGARGLVRRRGVRHELVEDVVIERMAGRGQGVADASLQIRHGESPRRDRAPR